MMKEFDDNIPARSFDNFQVGSRTTGTFFGLLRKITNSDFDTFSVVCQLHCDHVKKDKSKQKGDRVCPFSTHGNSVAVQGNIRAWNFRVRKNKSMTIDIYIFVVWSLLT